LRLAAVCEVVKVLMMTSLSC